MEERIAIVFDTSHELDVEGKHCAEIFTNLPKNSKVCKVLKPHFLSEGSLSPAMGCIWTGMMMTT